MTIFRKTIEKKVSRVLFSGLFIAFCAIPTLTGCTASPERESAPADPRSTAYSQETTLSEDNLTTLNSEPNTESSSTETAPSESAGTAQTNSSDNPKIADSPYTYLIQNAPTLTKNGITSYDFSAVAWKYMTEIATRFPNRNVSFGSRPGGFPKELAAPRKHDEAARYIFDELTSHGYVDLSNTDSATDTISDGSSDTVSPADSATSDENPHSASSQSANHHVSEITASVMAPELVGSTLPLNKTCNIIARLKGKTDSGTVAKQQIIIGAHYDGDGAGDNASGTALLLAVACGLKEHGVTPPVDLVFIFFDAEETGFYGSKEYVANMTEEEIASTLFMVNIDSIAFGDYCNLFGGRFDNDGHTVIGLGAYKNALTVADMFEINTCLTDELDGYFDAHGTGPALNDHTLFTNPWTDDNPPPKNYLYPSPMTGPWSDHEAFSAKGIDIIYLEASNMFAVGDGKYDCYSGYYESYNDTIGYYGMFMNTEYDTLSNLETYFPGRGRAHLSLFSRLLTALLQSPPPGSF